MTRAEMRRDAQVWLADVEDRMLNTGSSHERAALAEIRGVLVRRLEKLGGPDNPEPPNDVKLIDRQ